MFGIVELVLCILYCSIFTPKSKKMKEFAQSSLLGLLAIVVVLIVNSENESNRNSIMDNEIFFLVFLILGSLLVSINTSHIILSEHKAYIA